MNKLQIYQIIMVILILFCIILSINNYSSDNVKDDYKDIILSSLSPYISQSIVDYYGSDSAKSYSLWDAEIIEIKKLLVGQFYYEITIQVKTHEGAQNPPYGLETITIRHDYSGTYVVDFIHKDLTQRDSSFVSSSLCILYKR